MDIFKKAEKDLTEVFCDYISDLENKEKVMSNLRFTVPPVQFKSDYSTNAAMIVYKFKNKPMFEVANELAEKFREVEYIKEINVVGGYVNFIFKESLWQSFLVDLINSGSHFGDAETSKEKVLLEFVSANPTGPLHVGHCRGAILGLALSNLMKKAGFDVKKEYYVNDFGEQIATLVQSVQFRYEQVFGLHANEQIPEGCYPGEYLEKYAKTLSKKEGDKYINLSKQDFYKALKNQIVEAMMDIIRSNLKLLGLEFDIFTSETKVVESGEIQNAIEELSKMKRTVEDENGSQELSIIYKGILEAPMGGKNNAEDDEVSSTQLPQTLFRSTLYGDDKDRVVVRANGKSTYFASDIAYQKNKIDRGFNHLINILGADHGGYVKRITSAVTAISNGKAKLEVLLCQMVNLEKNGVPFKMSKRKGTFVLLSDVVKEVDINELKLFMLSKSPDTQMSFDLVKVKEKSKDNIVYYINYAYARTFSVLQKYKEVFGEDYSFNPVHFVKFIEDCPIQIKDIVVQFASFPNVIENSALKGSPNILVEYLNNFASKFHSLWNTNIRFISSEDKDQTNSMMAFLLCVQNILQNSFDALGVTPKKVMNNEK
ncbi:MAG: arginine--tRNA ligase [Clostridia bacterium]|nr:arginine--tRNA ligase [Clostridia bacterium]